MVDETIIDADVIPEKAGASFKSSRSGGEKVKIATGESFHPKLRTAQDALNAVKAGEPVYAAEVEMLTQALKEGGELAGKGSKDEIKALDAAAKEIAGVVEAATKERSFAAKMLLKHKSVTGDVIKSVEHAKDLGGVVKNISGFKAGGVLLATALGGKMIASAFSSKHPDFDQGMARGA